MTVFHHPHHLKNIFSSNLSSTHPLYIINVLLYFVCIFVYLCVMLRSYGGKQWVLKGLELPLSASPLTLCFCKITDFVFGNIISQPIPYSLTVQLGIR